MRYLSQLRSNQLKNKTCLLRVDLNIQDADLRGLKRGFRQLPLRITAILPTIEFLLKNKAKVVILSHRGRPEIDSRFKIHDSRFSLKPFVKILSVLLKTPIQFIDFNIRKSDVQKLILMLRTSDFPKLFLLENLRFFPEEEKNDKEFAKKLASLGDIYVNDAFAVSHRKNASVVALTQFLPSYAGLVLEKEIKNLDAVMKNFKKPLVVILGGAKVSDKIGLINNFLPDYFLIGGAMANTFFASQGLPVGDSLYEKDADLPRTFYREKVRGLRGLTRGYTRKIILPIDVVVWKRKILDMGPETIKNYQKIIEKARTVIWNGPMGFFENERFARGTKEIARAIRQLADKKAKIVIGGGETVAAFQAAISNFAVPVGRQEFRISNLFISTGGGAMLEYLAGKKLPGIESLK